MAVLRFNHWFGRTNVLGTNAQNNTSVFPCL
nr:MAG TPA: hypothetical protein [Caudoviricetes sp.]